MSGTKHTPGPWKNGRTADGKLVAFHVSPQAATEHCAAEPACAEWVANMRLLDAAPELLEQLTRCCAKLRTVLSETPEHEQPKRRVIERQLSDARAAIAKATRGSA